MISEASIQKVLDTVRIEEVVEDFVRLKKRGANLLGLCPFHQEKTPSFTVSAPGNFFKCFGCGKGGNAVQFIMEHEQMSFPEAIRYLADKYRIEIEETQRTDTEKVELQHREHLLSLSLYAARYFEDQLRNTDSGRQIGMTYFRERGFLDTTLKTFMLGFAPDERRRFTDQAQKDGFRIEDLQALGLVTRNQYDFFFKRVIFTIQDMSGRPIAFAGRILGKSSGDSPKYINSPESEIYHKSRVLYGMYQARQEIRKLDECIIVEGYTDVLSMHQSGVANVVASSGTSLTEEQIRLIKRFTANILILYDGDAAGIGAAMRGMDMVLEQDMNVRVALIPGGEDPDSFIRKTGESGFRQFLAAEATDFIAFKTRMHLDEARRDPVKKTHLIREVLDSIVRIPDSIKRTLYLQQAAEAFQVPEQLLVSELNQKLRKLVFQQRRKQNKDHTDTALQDEERLLNELDRPTAPVQPVSVGDSYQERDIARILVAYGHQVIDEDGTTLSEFILANLEDAVEMIDDTVYRKMISFAIERQQAGQQSDTRSYLDHMDTDIQKTALDLFASPFEYSHNWEDRWGLNLQTQAHPDKNGYKDALQAIMRFKLRKISRQCRENQQKIEELSRTGDVEQLLTLIKVHQRLLEHRRLLTEELRTVIL